MYGYFFLPIFMLGSFSTQAETKFSKAAAIIHLDTDLEAPFAAMSNILMEAKALSNFASQRQAEMSAHVSNERHAMPSDSLQSWVDIIVRSSDKITDFLKIVKESGSGILEEIRENEEAAYHALQILEYVDKITHLLSQIKKHKDQYLIEEGLEKETESVPDDVEESSEQSMVDTHHMQNHWRLMKKEADHIVHEAKRIKKSLIILKESTLMPMEEEL